MDKRFLYSQNDTITDFSTTLNEYRSSGKVLNFVAGEDYIYVGSRLPFNHTFFKLKSPNTVDSEVKAQYWSGSWTDFVEIIDETNGFKQSGFITFTPEREKPWKMESTRNTVDGLKSVTIYDMFWIRLSFGESFKGEEIPVEEGSELEPTYKDVVLQWVGNLFSNDNDLAGEHPDFVRPNVMKTFDSNKSSWEEQHAIAGKILIKDLISKNIIDDGSQVLSRSDYTLAAVSKVVELICTGLGDDYVDDKKAAREEYKSRLDLRVHKVDVNKNGKEDIEERTHTVGWVSR